jgi:hypothetical protein
VRENALQRTTMDMADNDSTDHAENQTSSKTRKEAIVAGFVWSDDLRWIEWIRIIKFEKEKTGQ